MAEAVDLEKLKAEITAIGDKIKGLKEASEVDKEAVGAAVQELLAAKKNYADNNNGIGVDGKPFGAKMTKADKKKAKAKEPGPAKPVCFLPNAFISQVSVFLLTQPYFAEGG